MEERENNRNTETEKQIQEEEERNRETSGRESEENKSLNSEWVKGISMLADLIHIKYNRICIIICLIKFKDFRYT